MRGKDYNTGLRGVLFEARHYERMGASLWLYGWLILRQTHQHGDIGCVLGGSPISYREIEEETGFKRRTLECWMRVLRRGGYIETEAAPGGVVVRIMKAKKYPQDAQKSTAGVRKFKEGVRKAEGGGTQNRVANGPYRVSNQQRPDRISSSSVVGTIENKEQRKIPNHSHTQIHTSGQNQNSNPSGLGSKQNREPYQSQAQLAHQQYVFVHEARMNWQKLRAEREDAVRRELYVGTGPEPERQRS